MTELVLMLHKQLFVVLFFFT